MNRSSSQSKNILKIGVIGCGYWGPNHIRNFETLPDSRVLQVADLEPKRLSHIQVLFPRVTCTQRYKDVLENPEIDAVVLATPVSTHFDMARESLLAGKHILVEKPIATSSREVTELTELAREKQKILMVGHTFLYHSAVRAIREIIQEGHLGKIHYISMQRLNLGLFQKDINVLWDLAPHDISILQYLLDESPIEVSAQGKASVNPEIEDVAMMTLRFASGVLAYIHTSWLDPKKTRQATIVGNKKMLVYNDISAAEKIEIYDKGVETPPHYDTFAEFQYAYRYGEKVSPYIEEEEPLKVQCRHFLDCIRTGNPPLSGPQNGGLVVRILEASDESLAQGGRFVPTQIH